MDLRVKGLSIGVAIVAVSALAAGCGGDDDSASEAAEPVVTTTTAPLATYRQSYLVLLTANECNAQETEAVQDEIAPDGTVQPTDFPVIQERLQPAWEKRTAAIATFQDGLANGEWSGELNPLVDALIEHLEEIRTVYRAGSSVRSFEEFGTLIFPTDGTAQSALHTALELPSPDELEATAWCDGTPAL